MAAAKKDLSAFAALHNRNVVIPNRIKIAFESMLKKEGPEAWEYEAEFVKLSGLSQTDIAQFREQFIDHVVVAKTLGRAQHARNVWFADVRMAKKAREG